MTQNASTCRPLLMRSQSTRLAKSTSSCSRSMVDTVLMAFPSGEDWVPSVWLTVLVWVAELLKIAQFQACLSMSADIFTAFILKKKDTSIDVHLGKRGWWKKQSVHSVPGLHQNAQKHIHHSQRSEENEGQKQETWESKPLYDTCTM